MESPDCDTMLDRDCKKELDTVTLSVIIDDVDGDDKGDKEGIVEILKSGEFEIRAVLDKELIPEAVPALDSDVMSLFDGKPE